jgi:hypothetical protein
MPKGPNWPYAFVSLAIQRERDFDLTNYIGMGFVKINIYVHRNFLISINLRRLP